MTDRELMQMALDAFEWNYNTDLDNIPDCNKWLTMMIQNITVLRERLSQPDHEWVGLTEVDIYDAMDNEDEFEFAKAIEAKLKEKNA